MVTQLCKYTKNHWIVYKWTLWYITCISVKQYLYNSSFITIKDLQFSEPKIPLPYLTHVLQYDRKGLKWMIQLLLCNHVWDLHVARLHELIISFIFRSCMTQMLQKYSCIKIGFAMDFPGGSVVENLPVSAGDTGSSPGPGRSHMPQSN